GRWRLAAQFRADSFDDAREREFVEVEACDASLFPGEPRALLETDLRAARDLVEAGSIRAEAGEDDIGGGSCDRIRRVLVTRHRMSAVFTPSTCASTAGAVTLRVQCAASGCARCSRVLAVSRRGSAPVRARGSATQVRVRPRRPRVCRMPNRFWLRSA